jgi:hypothetical protein
MKLIKSQYWVLFLLVIIGLSSCNLPAPSEGTPSISVTEAYQTVEARLTQAIKLTFEASKEPPLATSSPTATFPAAVEMTATESIPTVTESSGGLTPGAMCDLAAPGVPIDVTIPDDTELQPGESFTKVWRLQNIGTCSWTSDYALVWFSGEKLGAQQSVPLNGKVDPGQIVEVSVDMVAPKETGTYQSNWKLRNPNGLLFGIGPGGVSAFWVRIIVVEAPTATSSPPPPATTTPTVTPTITVQVSGSISLQPEDRLDLDTGLVNPGSGEDLAYMPANGNHILEPVGIAAMAVFGNTQPTLEDCQNISLNSDPLNLEGNLFAGTYICFRTNQALPGWIQISGFEAETGTLSLEILTWAIP